jgi:type II restriction/modification system DNA methylase subunit YeeA
LPLVQHPNIVHGNALRLDWTDVVGREADQAEAELFILGNPPFIGKKVRSDDQNDDMGMVCGGIPTYGVLDYVVCWFVKAADFIQGSRVKVAFVSTNSISQGEQVGILWGHLLDDGIDIHFDE